ncbi:Reverse transcriptase domain-containing protein [Aphis craccivora]|uniref:Reverse transcriptase domain-containing protein n=1 Tax=Aphis craccivora TaxID=307492 RepID=A0A6G0Y563_APHCR|nr:Reverse transcriptase domain-containing protein [Aphis craccivora]
MLRPYVDTSLIPSTSQSLDQVRTAIKPQNIRPKTTEIVDDTVSNETLYSTIIGTVLKHPALWDHRIPLKDQTEIKKRKLWELVHLECGVCERKKKLQTSSSSGSTPLKVWEHFEELKFLEDIVAVEPSISSNLTLEMDKSSPTISNASSSRKSLRQGDALSPTLFNIDLESVMREGLDDGTGLRIGEGHQIKLAAYADDIVIIGETEEDLKRLAEKLIMSRREQVQNALVVGGFTFERVSIFKYLGVDVNQQANSHKEIERRITTGNKSYFALVLVFKSRLISKNIKIRLYKVLIRPIVLYTCGAWAKIKSDEKRLLLFERRILRRIYGPKRNEENVYERRTNAELREIFKEPNIVGILKSRRISWAGHIWRAEG